MSGGIVEVYSNVVGWVTGGNTIPWRDSEFVAGCQREYDAAQNESGSSDEHKRKTKMKLCAALVHSRQIDDDVRRGIEMLGDPLGGPESQSDDDRKDKIYFLAVGYYRCQDYSRSKELIDYYLRESPNSSRAWILKRAIEDEARNVHGDDESNLTRETEKVALGSGFAGAIGLLPYLIKQMKKKMKKMMKKEGNN